MVADDLLLQRGTRLLHIGPHKTGTSALQGALHQARERLAAHGVVYPGRGRQTLWPILAVTGQPALLGEPRPDIAYWDSLVRAVAAAGDQRVVVSSEFFAEASDAAARRVVTDLGGPQVHVVATLRPLARILPSQWQQYVQNGFRVPYGEWLAGILRYPPKTPTPGFWRRHRHDDLISRWSDAGSPENLTVVVVDESDRLMLLRTFESMLGLPSDFLVPADDADNRSLTLAEAEVVRMLNLEFKRQEWPDRSYPRFMRYGAVHQMKTARQPSPDEPRIVTPAWALERAAEIGAEMAANIAALGVRVVGDLSALGQLADPSDLPPAPRAAVPRVPPQAASGSAQAATRMAAHQGAAAQGAAAQGAAHQSLAPLGAPQHTATPQTAARQAAVGALADAPARSPALAAPGTDLTGQVIPAEAAVHAILGAFIAGGVAAPSAADLLREVDAKSLARVLLQRVRTRVRRTLRLAR